MELPESCKNCDKPKTVHLTQIINNQATKIHLCGGCAYAAAAESKISYGVLETILKEKEQFSETSTFGQSCNLCGTTLEEFKKIGRMGCPNCYTAFTKSVQNLLPDMHRGTHHCGKVPGKVSELESLEDRLIQLELQIEAAIASEEYEQAALFRDELKEVKQQIHTRVRKAISMDSGD